MSFSFISKIALYISFIFIFSCQDTFSSFANKDKIIIENDSFKYEMDEFFDFNSYDSSEVNGIDIYTFKSSNYNFLNKELNKLKINNYQAKYNNNIPINVIFFENNIYSVNFKGDLVKFDIDTGKLIEKYKIELDKVNKEPVSFSLYKDDFIVSFKSGTVVRINKFGKIVWKFKNQELLNTPIKIYDDSLIILYPENIFFLEPSSGEIIYQKNIKSSNIIQSSGGKIENYYNILFILLSNSEFSAVDTFLFEEHNLNLDKIEFKTSLNNLNDQIHVYKNFLIYLDNGNILHTYDINKNNFILNNFTIDNSSSIFLLNNSLISKNEDIIDFHNILNGNLFKKININKILNKKSIIINASIINKKIHLFTDNGKLIIFNKDLDVETTIDLKIKNINKVYIYQNKIFINTEKGITFIY